MQALAEIYRQVGRAEECVSLAKEAAERMERVRGRDHPDTLYSKEIRNEYQTRLRRQIEDYYWATLSKHTNGGGHHHTKSTTVPQDFPNMCFINDNLNVYIGVYHRNYIRRDMPFGSTRIRRFQV